MKFVFRSGRILSLRSLGTLRLAGITTAMLSCGLLNAQSIDDKAAEKARRESDLRTVEENLKASEAAKRALETEIAALKTDRAKLQTALFDAARKVQGSEVRTEALERRLQELNAQESAIRASLEARRGVIGEVLAALQRMGRRPPPALLVRPEDMLEAVRSSLLLGAVVPELRAESERLVADLSELVKLRTAMASDREALKREAAALVQEQERLSGLIEARQNQLAEAEKNIGAEREQAQKLAGDAKTLKELIERMERDIASVQRAAEDARKAAEAQLDETKRKLAAASFRDPARLAPKIPFAEAKGSTPLPVFGETVRAFGAAGGGGSARGVSFATRAKAVVSSPADGWVAYAGSFRSYGNLLIINAGGGYYILLAGMGRIDVDVGQFVLVGEPVAAMGERIGEPGASNSIDKTGPVLYVEFRKDGGSIDPSPWWMKSEKVRG